IGRPSPLWPMVTSAGLPLVSKALPSRQHRPRAKPTNYSMPKVSTLDVYLREGKLIDVRLDGESVHPTWFKIEWKESGELSAKVKGVRLATRYGDEIAIHQAE